MVADMSVTLLRLTKKAEPPPTRGVNRDSGTASANGGWLRRLVRQHGHKTKNSAPASTALDEKCDRAKSALCSCDNAKPMQPLCRPPSGQHNPDCESQPAPNELSGL